MDMSNLVKFVDKEKEIMTAKRLIKSIINRTFNLCREYHITYSEIEKMFPDVDSISLWTKIERLIEKGFLLHPFFGRYTINTSCIDESVVNYIMIPSNCESGVYKEEYEKNDKY